MKNCKKHLRIFIAVITVVCVFLCGFSVSAETKDDVPYNTYTYWDAYGSKSPVKIKATHSAKERIDGISLGIGAFSDLQYIFTFNNSLYILDSGNSRIVILDSEYKVVNIIKDLSYNGEALDFTGSKGLFADDSGLYIADTEHERVIHIDGGAVKHILTRPDDPSIPSTFAFNPSRLIRDKSGYIYLLCEGSYYGMMVFSDTYEFFGFFGANNVKTTFASAIKDAITSMFNTEEKHKASIKALPFSLIDLCIDPDGFVVAINGETVGQLRRFGFSGTNTFVKKGEFVNKTSDSFNFADNQTVFLDKTNNAYYQSKFRAVTVDSDGYYYLIDDTNGKIFIYDNKCNIISVFGGGRQKGSQLGTFVSPSSLAVFGDSLLVSDFSTNIITVFNRTDYGEKLMYANTLTNQNKYKEAEPIWEELLDSDKACQQAYRGIAKTALKEKNYSKAMEYAKKGLDREIYAAAFENVRNDFLLNNFVWIAIIAVVLVGGLVVLITKSRKKQLVFIKNETVRTALRTPFHPLESMQNVKYKKLGSPIAATVILAVFYISTVSVNLNAGFMFSTGSLSNFNSVLLLLGTVGAVALWTVANWLVCILFDGKGKIRDIYCVTCYCLTPLIIYNFLYIILSNFLIPSATSPFALLSNICYLYTAVLLLLMITVIHEFSFFKAIASGIVTLIGMAIVAFVLFAMLTLWQDMIAFVIGLFNEATLR